MKEPRFKDHRIIMEKIVEKFKCNKSISKQLHYFCNFKNSPGPYPHLVINKKTKRIFVNVNNSAEISVDESNWLNGLKFPLSDPDSIDKVISYVTEWWENGEGWD